MDKPVSLSVKDWIIRNMSGRMMIPERTIETVINTQFEQAYNVMKDGDILEFSGFGKLIFNKKKAVHKLRKYEEIKQAYEKWLEQPLTEQRKKTLEIKLQSVTKDIELLKPRVNGN